MNTKKTIILGFLIFAIVAVTILTSCGENHISLIESTPTPSLTESTSTPSLIESTPTLSEQIENENMENLSLTIYYREITLSLPVTSIELLMDGRYDYKTVISGTDLEEHIDLFKQISDDDLVPFENAAFIDVHWYYVLESKENGKLFDVTMWGGRDVDEPERTDVCVFVNGLAVEYNDIFFDVILPFLPEDMPT